MLTGAPLTGPVVTHHAPDEFQKHGNVAEIVMPMFAYEFPRIALLPEHDILIESAENPWSKPNRTLRSDSICGVFSTFCSIFPPAVKERLRTPARNPVHKQASTHCGQRLRTGTGPVARAFESNEPLAHKIFVNREIMR